MRVLPTFVVAAALLAGCSRADAPAPTKTVENPNTAPVAAVAQPAASKTLSERYPEWNVGTACEDDRQCDGALRCIDARCDFPAAMTGRAAGDSASMTVLGRADGARFELEVADDDWEETRGLMFRREMAKGWGMIFVFVGDAPRSFWMRNTLMPLDMVFVRSDGVVDSVIEKAEPLTLTPRRSKGPAQYVVELAGGQAAAAGIAAGVRLSFDNLPAGKVAE